MTYASKVYEGQAEIYDRTRSELLPGHGSLLSLSAAHLRVSRKSSPEKRLVWVDIGGGTGRFIVNSVLLSLPVTIHPRIQVLTLKKWTSTT